MERTWGPPFSQYSQYSFKPREHRVLREDAARSLKLYKIPPLSLIESTLYISSCGTDGPGTADDRQRTVATILGYMVATAKNEHESVLEYYYGFLCLRRLLHLTCRYVLKETDSSDHEGGFLQQGANENDVFQATAFAALDKAAEASASESRFERFCNIFTHSDFLLDRTAREWFTTIPFRGLWGERDRVLSLCVQGLLPGFSLLLLAMVTTFSQDQREHNSLVHYLYLQDFGHRLFLVGSRRDRQILQPVCMATVKKTIHWPINTNRFLRIEDSRTISRAYSDLLYVWSHEGWSTKSFPTDLMAHLALFVLHMSSFNPFVTFSELLETAHAVIQFLWLIFEHRGSIVESEHFDIRYHATPVFSYLRLVQDKVSTKAEQFELAQLITDAEVISLSGRILLLIFFEGRDFDTMEFAGFQDFIDKLDDFQEAVYKSVSAFPGHFNSSKIEWAKTMAQLDLWLALGKFDGFDRKEGGITMQVLSSARVWRRCTNVMVDFHIAIQHCAYPRCFQLFTRQGRLRVRYMCQKCNTAVYCDTNCQRAHWELATSDSHSLQCFGPRGKTGRQE